MTKGDILNSKNKNISMLEGTVANKGIAFGTISFLKELKLVLKRLLFQILKQSANALKKPDFMPFHS